MIELTVWIATVILFGVALVFLFQRIEKLTIQPPSKENINITNLTSWSKYIKQKSGNQCLFCGKKIFLEAHHILPRLKFPEFELDPDNGVCACSDCHRSIEKITRIIFKKTLISENKETKEKIITIPKTKMQSDIISKYERQKEEIEQGIRKKINKTEIARQCNCQRQNVDYHLEKNKLL